MDIKRIFLIGALVATTSFLACEQFNTVRRTMSPPIIHSAESSSPYSVLEGTIISIRPYNYRFEIPQSWLIPKPGPDEHVKNIFLSWEELNEVNRIDREPNGFDSEDADVINAVLPFGDCVAHIGDRGWGNGSWNDLQVRVYVTKLKEAEIVSRIESNGLPVAKENFEEASLISEESKYKNWKKQYFDIIDTLTHFILGKRLEFYFRPMGDNTAVFVFLRADSFEKEISLILTSFSDLQP